MWRPNSRVVPLALILASLVGTGVAATEKVLYSFSGSDGSVPWGSLIFDKAGNLYGTTYQGGAYGYGTVFELTPLGDGVWTETVLHSFNSNGHDGAGPDAALVFDKQGNLYGTTYYGGAGACTSGQYPGCGTVFRLCPNLKGSWTEEVIHTFRAGTDGAFPASALVLGSVGILYGTTASGGTGPCTAGDYVGCGTVFVLIPVKNGRWESIAYSFQGGNDGEFPNGPVLLDAANNLYGTAEEGGASCPAGVTCGVVFKLSCSHGKVVNTILHDFVGGNDGQWPTGPLISDAHGDLYGTTIEGGGNDLNCLYGCGTVFELSRHSSGWTERVLYSFSGGNDGIFPFGGVIEDNAGNLYGTTELGGVGGGSGTVFELDSKGNETVLYSFTGGSDGADPYVGLTSDASGNLYGVTALGGTHNDGVVFEVIP
jgi:uncharacterized repeat protein (TIGR03803 family)